MKKFHQQIDNAIIERRPKEVRDYLGASIIGHACSRKIQYQYKNIAPDVQSDSDKAAKRLRIFRRGDLFEKVMVEWLMDAGFQIEGSDYYYPHCRSAIGKDALIAHRIGFKEAAFGGHIDGLITKGPEIEGLTYPFIWENKAVGEKTFNSISKHGIEKYPIYQGQIALYQAYLNYLNPALFTVINCNTMEIYAEMVPFNAGIAQEMSDKAARIIEDTEQGIEMPRVSNDPEYFECRWCEYKETCWKKINSTISSMKDTGKK